MQARHRQREIDQINFQLNRLDWQEATNNSIASAIKTMQEKAIKWQNTTPVPEVQLSDAEINAILKMDDVKRRFVDQGVEPVGGEPSLFADHIRAEIQKWAKVVKEANIQPE